MMGSKKVIQPLNEDAAASAAGLVRQKLQALYADEPSVLEEQDEISHTGVHSKHQSFISELLKSNKSLADIQAEWHKYYESLPDHEKHEVWQEFYEQHNKAKARSLQKPVKTLGPSEALPAKTATISDDSEEPAETVKELHKKIIKSVNANGKLKTKHHVKSVVFALAFASFVTAIFFFITNNERFITPFIQPSVNASASPIITDGSQVGPEAKIIIPKINLDAPLVTDLSDNSEKAIQDALEHGVALYPFTGKPGEKANPTFFGHSSNNLFNQGDYKFVFVRLHQLEVGDTFAINYNSKQYVYRIFSRDIVKPERVDILYAQPKEVMATLITCDPPGTSNNRLVLHAEQISPDPAQNAAASQTPGDSAEAPSQIPSNAPSLWSRLFGG